MNQLEAEITMVMLQLFYAKGYGEGLADGEKQSNGRKAKNKI